MAPASSSSASAVSSRPKKRYSLSPAASCFSFSQSYSRWTREQLLKNLELIGDLGAPLPPTLPPSPPASRAASPAGLKRKHDPSSDHDAVKRPRTTVNQDRSPPQSHPPSQPQDHFQPPPPPPPSARQSAPTPHIPPRSEPCEDGEVQEEPAGVPPVPSVDVPIRRPKKGKPSVRHFDDLHTKYHQAGRVLKYSGDARLWSAYPPSHREYRPLHDPPPPNSPYHKHGGLIARLELLDALICFTYSIWSRDYGRGQCYVETWTTIEAFLGWCKQKWHVEEGTSDAERAFLGLIWMIEAFVQGRKMYHTIRGVLHADVDKVHESTSKKIAAAASTAMEGDPVALASFGLSNGKAPPMLPSPSSTNSTPVNREGSTPNSQAGSRPAKTSANAPSRQPHYNGSVPFKLLPQYMRESTVPIPPHVMTAMSNVSEPISPPLVQNLKELTTGYSHAASCTQTYQQTLNLPLLRRSFPKTWARMMYSTLLPTEEYEPDFEDEEGELYWPDQCINGEGIGWVCLMGKAMINEFGKAYGYKGLDGVVPKPKPGPAPSNNNGPPPPSYAQSQAQFQRSGPPSRPESQPPSYRTPVGSSAPR
ncbi:hypothetical protein CVT26_000303 [Gymnopilus dilepis]|uniref:Uncharacterized protein n=1 Tax=Gymnopilus dilepis TaxID=231916 RepID=A0A409VHF8_9AGAR|nr:hypothetical protein CVT26_000303 [Gymnopilus dilepis]